jgi:hypothetical protein
MAFTVMKLVIAVSVIMFASWLSGKKPEMAGFITALPLVSILAIAFSYTQHHDAAATAQYAKSIIIAVPISWLFFIPFFFMERWGMNFWLTYATGLALLPAGYLLHRYLLKLI